MSDKALFQKVLGLEPTKLKKWIQENRSNLKFNWLGLAEHAALTSRIKKSYEWGSIAILLYEKLDQETGDLTYVLSAMNLREFLIRNIESKKKDPVLDPKVILAWFAKSVEFSPYEVQNLTSDWINLDKKTRSSLKNIKNKLSIVLKLYSNPNIKDLPDELNYWAQTYDKIP